MKKLNVSKELYGFRKAYSSLFLLMLNALPTQVSRGLLADLCLGLLCFLAMRPISVTTVSCHLTPLVSQDSLKALSM